MESTNENLAVSITGACLGAGKWPSAEIGELVRRATDSDVSVAIAASRVFFRDVVEKLCDLFDEQATAAYARLFAEVVAQVLPEHDAGELFRRYQRVRPVRRYHGSPQRVCVLSRVTLGADVVVTGQVLLAAKRAFPDARICFAGPSKNAELFAGDRRIVPLATAYGRAGTLRDRLLASGHVRSLVDEPGTLVIDPDSRLTQLGLIPVCEESGYLFFESRAYGAGRDATLAQLTSEWLGETLGVEPTSPYLFPPDCSARAAITVSLGVGENIEKWAGEELELAALEKLVSYGWPVLIDRGAGGEEADRVERIVSALGHPRNLALHEGSFASFARQIMQSKLYFGYDSAGQHVAAASHVALVTVFTGFAAERTFERWRPSGAGLIRIVKIAHPRETGAIGRTLHAISAAAEAAGLS